MNQQLLDEFKHRCIKSVNMNDQGIYARTTGCGCCSMNISIMTPAEAQQALAMMIHNLAEQIAEYTKLQVVLQNADQVKLAAALAKIAAWDEDKSEEYPYAEKKWLESLA